MNPLKLIIILITLVSVFLFNTYGLEIAQGTVSDPGPPATPTLTQLYDTETGGNLSVEWTWSASCDVDHYRVYYKNLGTAATGSVAIARNGDVATYSANLTGLSNCVDYEVWVVAIDWPGNESIASNVLSAKPTPPGPAAPTGLALQEDCHNSTVLHASWNPNPECDLNYYSPTTPSGGSDAGDVSVN